MVDHLTLQSREKVQECEDFLVETVTERPELVSTFTPSRKSLSWTVTTNRRVSLVSKKTRNYSREQFLFFLFLSRLKSAGKWQRGREKKIPYTSSV